MTPRIWGFVVVAVLAVLAVPGAQATDGQPLILGQDNSSSSLTSITYPGVCVGPCGIRLDASGIFVQSDERGFASLTGGSPAIQGFRQAGTILKGQTEIGDAVVAFSNDGNAVVAQSFSGGAGVLGTAATGGDGLKGTSASGVGVRGSATASGGTGVVASSADDGTALQVTGKAKFSRSGALTIPAGSSSVTQTGINLDSQSLVLATLQQNRQGLWIQSAVPNASADSFTINLNHATNADTVVAWFIVN